MVKNILNLGDAAIYYDFGDQINIETNRKVINYFNSLKNLNLEEIINITPSYNKLIISFNLKITSFLDLKEKIQNIKISTENRKSFKKIKLPICCEDDFFLDKERLTNKLNLSPEEILKKFLNQEYFCYMTGFIAGMPFMGNIDKDLRIERLKTPRVKVPKGSVGITEQFTNIYTFESPGGWNIIGNTPQRIFDSGNKDKPIMINPGDEVSFFQISKNEYEKLNEK
ncbi:MAG: allophanate hydrolase subunit 1 [Candidatus Pelagibacter sp.]|tara:strand:+ start:72 stop:749 length:678 start_codon:yes stop_codon:yes gene_type:complete